MNTKEKRCVVAEQICEALIGGAIGVVVSNNVLPKCNNIVEKTIVVLGTGVAGFALGRKFAKGFYKYCDAQFGTELGDVIDDF